MKKFMKKLTGILLMAALLLGISLPAKDVSASSSAIYLYGSFAVTELTGTSVTIDYRNVYYDYISMGATVSGYNIYMKDINTGSEEVLIQSPSANEVYGTITGLVPGNSYSIVVKALYQFPESAPSEGYDYVVFTTPENGVAPSLDTISLDPGIATTTPAPVVVPQPATTVPSVQSGTVSQLTVSTPSVATVKMVGQDVALSLNPVGCNGYEYGVFNKRTNALVRSEESTSSTHAFYNLSRKNIYYVKARAYSYDSNYNKVYSGWSGAKYFVSQPKINKNSSKLRKHHILIKWAKVSGASSYSIQMRKRYTNKWYNVKTVSGSKGSYKITKFRKKGFNTHRNNYEVRVKANARINGRTYHSTGNDFIYTYTYIR